MSNEYYRLSYLLSSLNEEDVQILLHLVPSIVRNYAYVCKTTNKKAERYLKRRMGKDIACQEGYGIGLFEYGVQLPETVRLDNGYWVRYICQHHVYCFDSKTFIPKPNNSYRKMTLPAKLPLRYRDRFHKLALNRLVLNSFSD